MGLNLHRLHLQVCFLAVVLFYMASGATTAAEEDNTNVKKILEEEKTTGSGELFQDDLDIDIKRVKNFTKEETIEDFGGSRGTTMGTIIVPNLPEEDISSVYHTDANVSSKVKVETKMLIYVGDPVNDTRNFEDIVEETTTTNGNITEDFASNEVLVNNQEIPLGNNSFASISHDIEVLKKPFPFNDTVSSESSIKISDESLKNHSVKVTRENYTTKNRFPNFNFEEQRYDEDGSDKIRKVRADVSNTKEMQRRTFDLWGMLGVKDNKKEKIVQITREIPVPVPYHVEKKIPVPVKVEVERPIPFEVPKPYPVTFEKKIYFPVKQVIHAPYPVFKKVPYMVKISVDRPIPVHISKPYPVYIEKKVPYPVEKYVPFPVKIPVDHPIPVQIPVVKKIYFPVEKKIHYPVPVKVEKPVPVPVERPYPFYIEKNIPVPMEEQVSYPVNTEEHNVYGYSNQNYNLGKEHDSYSLTEEKKIDDFANLNIQSYLDDAKTNFHGFVPSPSTTGSEDHARIQKKNDNVFAQESRKLERLETSSTTQLPVTQNKIAAKLTDFSTTTNKPVQEFGKKIK